ncbi:MAG: cytidine deaminase [Gemmataceae bacterium]|nr:cytidine deaminase [Gemmataceae bacterium]MCS7270774.1 cytidine deaminase [Gemmataceae bacterium]MDW8244035.1 cytidine deaminase [Thermogemmata sp.]
MLRDDALVQAAWQAWANAYAPYSGLAVGAAVETADGQIFAGCNVENASYGLTLCAERNALAQAVARGQRGICRVVVVADTTQPLAPCGACRQWLWELAPAAEVILLNRQGEWRRSTTAELLPLAFDRGHLLGKTGSEAGNTQRAT